MLRLSKAGEAVYNEVAPFALAYERDLMQPLDDRERSALDRLLRILLGRATEMGPASPHPRVASNERAKSAART